MNNSAVSLGIIGMGGIAGVHLENLLRIERVVVTAICDIEPERAVAAAKRTGGRAYEDWRKMLDGRRFKEHVFHPVCRDCIDILAQ